MRDEFRIEPLLAEFLPDMLAAVGAHDAEDVLADIVPLRFGKKTVFIKLEHDRANLKMQCIVSVTCSLLAPIVKILRVSTEGIVRVSMG